MKKQLKHFDFKHLHFCTFYWKVWKCCLTFEPLLGCSTHAPEPNQHRITRKYWSGEWPNFLGRGRTTASSREDARKAAAGRSDPSRSCVHGNCASSYLRGLHSHRSTDGDDLNAHAASHALTSAGSCALFLFSQVGIKVMFRSRRFGVISYLEAAARPFKAQINPLESSTGNDALRPHPHAHARTHTTGGIPGCLTFVLFSCLFYYFKSEEESEKLWTFERERWTAQVYHQCCALLGIFTCAGKGWSALTVWSGSLRLNGDWN